MYRNTRNLLPLITGICFGLIGYWQIYKIYNEPCGNIKYENSPPTSKHQSKREEIVNNVPKTVKAKPSRFSYDFRPYFVYSELGFKYPVVVAVKTNEERLRTFGIALNNTWSQGFQTVVFFTPYSKKETFHDTYIKKLNLNVVQLPDIVDSSTDVDFSFRILQYMKEHYVHKYSWFVQTTDETYVNPINLIQFLHSLNSSSRVFVGKPVKRNSLVTCDHKTGIILSRTALLDLAPQNCPRKETDFGLALSTCFYRSLNILCKDDEVRTLIL